MDLAASLALLALGAVLGVAFAVRRTRGAVAYGRVEKDGGSALLDKEVMNGAYWALQPLGRACVSLGVSANAVTLASLVLAALAGVLLAFGHFGLAAVAVAIASLGDALDGIVARLSGTSSSAGEVLDAAVDRYSEFFFLGGLVVCYRASAGLVALVLAALLASFMVSYASAKAEALGVEPPRGAMRRAERATFLGLGALLVPVSQRIGFGDAPMLAAVGLVAVVGNVSAARRLTAVARAVSPDPRRRAPRETFLTLARHQLGSMAATAVDFGTMATLVETGIASPVLATLGGASLGAVTNFLLGRRWIFRATDAAPFPQALRYALISATSAGLNAAGEHLVHDRLGVQYIAARAVVAVTVSLVWNFPMQRHFVFPRTSP